MKIIFPFNDGIGVIHPAPESGLSIEEIARKDCPQGAPYKLINDSDIPEDRTFRSAWEADFSEPDGYGDPEGWWVDYWAKEAAAKAEALANQPTTETEEPEE